jgi:hypothetical protein
MARHLLGGALAATMLAAVPPTSTGRVSAVDAGTGKLLDAQAPLLIHAQILVYAPRHWSVAQASKVQLDSRRLRE